MTDSDATSILEPLMWEFGNELTDSDETICGVMAQTNADCWHLDDCDLSAWFKDEAEEIISFSVELNFTGDQIEDRFHFGDIIKAKVEGQFVYKDEKWEVADYNVLKTVSGDSDTDWRVFYADGNCTEEDIDPNDWVLVKNCFDECSKRYSRGEFFDDFYEQSNLKTSLQIDIENGEKNFTDYLVDTFRQICNEEYTSDGRLGIESQTEFIEGVIYAKSYNESLEEWIKPTIWNWLEKNYEEAKEKAQRKYEEEKEKFEYYEYLDRLGLPYQDFLQHPYWKNVRNKIIERDKCCRTCGSIVFLEVHHITYENRANELNHLEDLTLLCRDCHQLIHDNYRWHA